MKRQVALDIETTGRSEDGYYVGEHRIVEIGCVEIVDRKITGRSLHYYVNPERPVDDEAYKVHGLSGDFLHNQPKFQEIAHELLDFIRDSELLIHIPEFDVGFLDKEWLLFGLKERTSDIAKIVNVNSLAMKILKGQKGDLDNLCNLYDIDLNSRAFNGALTDAEILAEVYLAMTDEKKN